ncbi:MAG: CapA family protein [Candidatus Hydrogenedentales bacterium]
MESLAARELLKALIAEGAIALIYFFALYDRLGLAQGRRWLNAMLVLLAVAAAGAYFEFGQQRYERYMNPHDVYHYYLGSKYAPELGYYGLYGATLAADRELDGSFPARDSIRDLRDHTYMPARVALADAESYKAAFTAERWESFKKDVSYFRGLVPTGKWRVMLRDKGYNGTPVWSMVGGMFTNLVPTSSSLGMLAIVLLDVALVALALGFVWWAFGARIMLFALIFFGTNFVMSFVHIKGALLRLDWVAATVMSLCLVRRERYGWAGLALGYASAVRVFPLIFAFGLGARALWRLVRERRLDLRYVYFFAALACTAAALGIASWAIYGTGLWREFFAKIAVHNADISTTRVGFKYIFLLPWDSGAQKAAAFETHRAAWLIIQAVVLLATFVAARRQRDYEALALGFVPVFFLTAPTFYYFVILIVPALFFLPRIQEIPYAIGAVALFAFSVAGYVLHQSWDLGYFLSFLLSMLLFILCAYMLGVSLGAAPVAETTAPAATSTSSRTLLAVGGAAAAGLAAGIAGWLFIGSNAPSHDTTTANASSTLTTEPDGAELVFVGDIMLSRNVARSLETRNLDFTYPFMSLSKYTQSADIAFGNLECPISDRGTALEGKTYLFRAPPESATGLAAAGFDVLSLANNHTLDYGLDALTDTEQYLAAAGIPHVGLIERDLPQTPLFLTADGVRIGFLAYADPESAYAYPKEFASFSKRPAPARMELIQQDLMRLRGRADIVVVSLHWGTEYKTTPDPRQRELGRWLIEQGVDIVAGHHPHVQQEPEWYGDGVILYSMGNYVFDQWTRPATRVSRLYRIIVAASGVQHVAYLPVEIPRNDWQPRAVAEEFIPVTRSTQPAGLTRQPTGANQRPGVVRVTPKVNPN